jgi:hypothetical protein
MSSGFGVFLDLDVGKDLPGPTPLFAMLRNKTCYRALEAAAAAQDHRRDRTRPRPAGVRQMFAALRYFTIEGSDCPCHAAIAGHLRWRGDPKRHVAVDSRIRRPNCLPMWWDTALGWLT